MNFNRADTLALNDPAEYEKALHGFFLVLGERRLWWQRCAQADNAQWVNCVRFAIKSVATDSRIPPPWLADALDVDDALPRTRRRVLRLARERLAQISRAA